MWPLEFMCLTLTSLFDLFCALQSKSKVGKLWKPELAFASIGSARLPLVTDTVFSSWLSLQCVGSQVVSGRLLVIPGSLRRSSSGLIFSPVKNICRILCVNSFKFTHMSWASPHRYQVRFTGSELGLGWTAQLVNGEPWHALWLALNLVGPCEFTSDAGRFYMA